MGTSAPPTDETTRTRAAGDRAAQRALVGPQQAVSGTPVWRDGETTPDDHVHELADPVKRMEIFEEMREADEAIHTALFTREQLVRQANWMLAAPSDDPRDREILEHVEDNLYPHLESLLTSLLGAVHFGVGLCEPVFAWADRPAARSVRYGKVQRAARAVGRRIYLQKVVDIRPKTIQHFLVSPWGDLRGARQYAYLGSTFRKHDIPAEKLLMWTYDQKGADFWGKPTTRRVYKAYTFKNQVERLNILGIDRFGVGMPVAEGGEGWTDADFERLAGFLATWRSGKGTYLITPHGGKVDIKGGQGTVVAQLLEWLKHYAVAIAKAYMTQGNELASTTDTGARALGEEFYEQSAGVVQADCEAIASILNERLIVPLVDATFGPQEAYPTFAPSQRVRQGSAVAKLVVSLIGKGVTWRPQDEAWLRDALGLPEVALDELEQLHAEREAKADAIAAAAGGPPGTPPKPGEKPATKPAPSASKKPAIAAGRRTLRLEAPTPAPKGKTYRTELLGPWEHRIVKPWALTDALDLEATRAAAEVQDVLRQIDADLAAQVALLGAGGVTSLAAALDSLRVPKGLRGALRTVMLAAAARARAMGAQAVLDEVERQRQPDVAAPARWTQTAKPLVTARLERFATGPVDDAMRDAQLRAQVEHAVAEECARREGAARAAALDALAAAPAADGEQLAPIARARVAGSLGELSTGRTSSAVGGVVNVAFGTGRSDGIDALLEAGDGDLVALVYSAVLDWGTCDECAKWDGAWFPIDHDATAPGAVKAPNPNCAGTIKRCRCLWIAVTAEEAPALIGPGKDFTTPPAPRAIPREVYR